MLRVIRNILCFILGIGIVFGFSYFSMFTIQQKEQGHVSGATNVAITGLTNYLVPLSADVFPIVDVANGTTKKINWGNIVDKLATIDLIEVFSPIFTTSSGLAALLGDETGSGNAVFSDSATFTNATTTTPYINVSGTEARGDILYLSDNGGTLSRLGVGANGTALSVSSGIPAWSSAFISFPYTGSSTFIGTTTWQTPSHTLGVNIFASTTAGETLTGNTLPQPVSLSTTTGRILAADADNNLRFDNFFGFVVQSGASGVNLLTQTEGVVEGFSGLASGRSYFVQDTVGTIGTSPGTFEIKVGVALSSTQLLIQRSSNEYVGTASFSQSTAGLTSCVAMATSTTMARTYIVSGSITNTTGSFSDTYPITKVGATSASSNAECADGASVGTCAMSASISSNIVTLSGSGTSDASHNYACSGTLYMYR